MATLLDIKARIKLVGNIKKITRAMQLVAAAKFTRAQNRAQTSKPYTSELQNILGVLSKLSREMGRDPGDKEKKISISFSEDSAPLETTRESLFRETASTKPGIALITADRGLCGAFNTRLIREAQEFIKKNGDKDCKLITLGKKGHIFFRNKETPIIYHYEGVNDKLDIDEIRTITSKLLKLYMDDEVDSIYLIYTRFKSALASTVVVERFLSILPSELEGPDENYILEPDVDAVFEKLIPLYATTKILSAFAESFASEYGARMTAMQLATKNAEEMLQQLIILRNRLRQATITRELAEIVGGAEALK